MNRLITPWDNPSAYLPIRETFAEQHQIDPDEAYKLAVYDEIRDGLRWVGGGVVAALVLIAVLT